MLLVLDVGNSNTTLGLYDGERLAESWRLTSERQRTVDEYGMMCRSLLHLCDLPSTTITAMAISSVVPPLDFTLFKMAEKFFNLRPLFVSAANAGMPLLIDNPAEAGSDRIVNAVAAYEKYGGPCIIVDFGTGTNFDVVSKQGEFIGGVICPGIQISADALFQRAARLYRVDIRHPEKVIGTNTTACLQSGLYFGSIGLVDGILQRMMDELGEKPNVIATGGLASLIGKGSQLIETIDQDLTLEGLRLIYQRHQSSVQSQS